VLLAGRMKDDVHIFQYPLRPNYRRYGDQGELKKVEMCISVDGGNPDIGTAGGKI
jgi:hypothetical protein